MNQAKYDSLPDDLKKVIDDNTGADFSAHAGMTQASFDAPGREIAEGTANEIVVLDEAEVARWKEVGEKVRDNWFAEMEAKGIDGEALYAKAQELIANYTK